MQNSSLLFDVSSYPSYLSFKKQPTSKQKEQKNLIQHKIKKMKDRYNRIPHTHLSTIELEESKGPVFEPLKLLAAAAGNLIVLQDT